MSPLPLALALLAGCVRTPVAFPECDPDDRSRAPASSRTRVSPVGALVPFDVDVHDPAGPASTVYGKTPEVVAVADEDGIDVLLQDLGPGGGAKLVRIERDYEDFVVTSILELDGLERIMGLARDEDGHRYVATGVAEPDTQFSTTPPEGEYRSNIVRIDKIAPDGEVLYTVDLDKARQATSTAPEQVINPMVAGTSRMVWGGGKVEILHAINTTFDGAIGQRHQKALATVLDAGTGAVTRAASIWVSHSFDQRLIYDGQGFVEMHLGDAYPRQIVMARVEPDSQPYPLLHVKGATGDNNTYSRLGAITGIPPWEDADFGYLAVFSTESTVEIDGGGPKNLALVRVRRDFETRDPATGDHLDPALPDTLEAAIDGTPYTSRLKWLTTNPKESGLQVERSRIVSLACDRYAVLWEEWTLEQGFLGTFGLVVDSGGDVLVPRAKVTDFHLPRGDDAFALDNTAAWISANGETGALYVNRVYADLSFTRDVIE